MTKLQALKGAIKKWDGVSSIFKKFNDASEKRSGMIIRAEWPQRMWPRSKNYRIVEYPRELNPPIDL